MKRTAFLLTFDTEKTELEEKLIEAIFSAFAEEDITPSMEAKEFDDEYGGPVIYIP